MFEWLGFAQARKRLPLDLPNETNNPKRLGPVSPNPPSQILDADESNSKLLKDNLERKPVAPLNRCQQPFLHRIRLEQICGLPLRRNLPPQFNRYDDCGRLPGLV